MFSIKTPTCYGIDIKNAINRKDWLTSLKSHDFFNMVQYTFPMAIKGLSTSDICESISWFFRLVQWVCAKTIDTQEFQQWKGKVPLFLIY
jgi:hypothetical protein